MTKINTSSYALRSGLKAAARIAVLLMAVILPQVVTAGMAKATDMTPQQSQSSRFFRLALNKSAVVSLPADAKDVVIGNNEIVDVIVKNKSTAYLFARKMGSTNIFFFDGSGQQIMALDLEVAVDTMALQNLIRRTLPGTHITVDVLGANVVLGGIAMNAQEAKTAIDLANQYIAQAEVTVTSTSTTTTGGGLIVNTIKIAGEDQVMLQVKIVEIQRDVLKQWGVNFGAAINAGSFAFNLSNINPFTNVEMAPGAGYGISTADSAGNSFTSIIRAMEGDGVLRMLAEPNLTAVSGQAASFKAGGEFPYQTCHISNTDRQCSIEFKPYGVGLDFTPTVLTEGRINLKIHTAVSELTQPQFGSLDKAGGVPALTTRAADTVLEIPDGGSMMLAGLIRDTTRQNINGTPGLKKLPILGALFRSREFISNQTELVVLVTPHIVRSVAQKQLESPAKNFNDATDVQSVLFGRLNRVYGSKDKEAPRGRYGGQVGYIVE
ncbi:type II and III secretion system protein family protein [Aestuariivirga litoralis]|uniref:type II and III secretion system protein family protein n=1 Tax=Aestuariivirga litoralis TaxID=2650924 RepID=UPI0018C6DE4A|nr:type II and III secretion system protein family protein [Aestuariivirga litoralis]